MLVLSRQRDQTIMIGDRVEITVVDIRGDKVRLGISAPDDVSVHRKEVYLAIRTENEQASSADPFSITFELESLVRSLGPAPAGASGMADRPTQLLSAVGKPVQRPSAPELEAKPVEPQPRPCASAQPQPLVARPCGGASCDQSQTRQDHHAGTPVAMSTPGSAPARTKATRKPGPSTIRKQFPST